MREHIYTTVISMGIMILFMPSVIHAEDTIHPVNHAIAADPPFYLIRPGTRIQNGPPSTWTHLVVKAQSRLVSGDLNTLPEWGAEMASRIRTVILADVGSSPKIPNQFTLRKVGIGLCMPGRDGGDIVVTADRAAELGFELGTLEAVVLESAETELRRGRMIVSTPTFGIYRSPTTMLRDGEHRAVEIFYGFLVDAESGGLRVVVWLKEPKTTLRRSIGTIVELHSNLVYECPINVRARRLLGTIPISWSFAMQDLLPGRSRTVSADLAETMEAVASGKSEPAVLERALTTILDSSKSIKGSSLTESAQAPAAASESDPEQSEKTSTAESARRETSRAVR